MNKFTALSIILSASAHSTAAEMLRGQESRILQTLTADQAYCLGALKNSGFVITQTADFSRWFGDGSIMQLAQAGTYLGLDGIQEYVNFAYTPWLFKDLKVLEVGTAPPGAATAIPNVQTIVRDDQQCEVTVAVKTCRTFVSPSINTTARTSADVLIGYRLFFDVNRLDAEEADIFVNRANIWYPDDYLSELFGVAFQTKALRKKNCEIMRDSCENTWKMNFKQADRTIDHCVEEMSQLDVANSASYDGTDFNGFVDGDTSGCRFLHGGFASDNPNHCAHISLKRGADPNGRKKCQVKSTYSRVSPESLFGATNIAFFNAVGEAYYGIPDGFSFSDSQTCDQIHPENYE